MRRCLTTMSLTVANGIEPKLHNPSADVSGNGHPRRAKTATWVRNDSGGTEIGAPTCYTSKMHFIRTRNSGDETCILVKRLHGNLKEESREFFCESLVATSRAYYVVFLNGPQFMSLRNYAVTRKQAQGRTPTPFTTIHSIDYDDLWIT